MRHVCWHVEAPDRLSGGCVRPTSQIERDMFANACKSIHETLYGFVGTSVVGPNLVNASNGTAFMIAPGVLVTAAHMLHVENDSTKPVHTLLEVIRSLDIGQKMENAELIAADTARDVALLRIHNPRSKTFVTLKAAPIPSGTSCGSLGFPLAQVVFGPTGKMFNLVERFQGANISAFHEMALSDQERYWFYETDALMYGGSSGCPGFLENGHVFAMHVRSAMEPTSQQQEATTGTQNLGTNQGGTRLAIAMWVPARDIIGFAKSNGIKVKAD